MKTEGKAPIIEDVELAARLIESYAENPDFWGNVCRIYSSGDKEAINHLRKLAKELRPKPEGTDKSEGDDFDPILELKRLAAKASQEKKHGDEGFFIDQMQGHCAELKIFSMTCRQLYHELNGNSSTDYRTGPNDKQWVQDRLEPAIDAMAFRLDELSKTFEEFVSYSFDNM